MISFGAVAGSAMLLLLLLLLRGSAAEIRVRAPDCDAAADAARRKKAISVLM